MSISLRRARQISFALLCIAAINPGHLRASPLHSTAQPSGVLRLGRDLRRRTRNGETAELANQPERVSAHRELAVA
jgi:hypothetical protein